MCVSIVPGCLRDSNSTVGLSQCYIDEKNLVFYLPTKTRCIIYPVHIVGFLCLFPVLTKDSKGRMHGAHACRSSEAIRAFRDRMPISQNRPLFAFKFASLAIPHSRVSARNPKDMAESKMPFKSKTVQKERHTVRECHTSEHMSSKC